MYRSKEDLTAGSAGMQVQNNRRSRQDEEESDTVLSPYERMIDGNHDFAIFKDKYTAVQTLGVYLLSLYKIGQIGSTSKHVGTFLSNLQGNPFSLKLYTDYMALPEEILKRVQKDVNESGAYQFYVMYIISQRILKQLETKEDWLTYVDGVNSKWKAGTAYAMQNLGSDLHTTPADVRADVTIDSLATRLDRLRDW